MYLPQKIFNPPPQFSRLGTLCPSYSCCLFVLSWDGGFLGFFLLLSVCLLFASVLYTCTLSLTLYQRQLASQGGQSSEVNTELSRTTSDLAEIGQQKTKTTTEVGCILPLIQLYGCVQYMHTTLHWGAQITYTTLHWGAHTPRFMRCTNHIHHAS